jgi:hypothetical protein
MNNVVDLEQHRRQLANDSREKSRTAAVKADDLSTELLSTMQRFEEDFGYSAWAEIGYQGR